MAPDFQQSSAQEDADRENSSPKPPVTQSSNNTTVCYSSLPLPCTGEAKHTATVPFLLGWAWIAKLGTRCTRKGHGKGNFPLGHKKAIVAATLTTEIRPLMQAGGETRYKFVLSPARFWNSLWHCRAAASWQLRFLAQSKGTKHSSCTFTHEFPTLTKSSTGLSHQPLSGIWDQPNVRGITAQHRNN